jgi:hypothetical protein
MLGAYVVADAFATYRWDHGRNLWLPVSKPWWSPFPTTAVGTLGGPFGDPCVTTSQHLRDSTSTSISMERATQATSPPGSSSQMTTLDS